MPPAVNPTETSVNAPSGLTGDRFATIGYERATPDEVIAKLREAGIELVVDVRAVAASRRPGFSKRALAAGLDEAGIGYVHLRSLGTPPAGRMAARQGRVAEMRAIFGAHLGTPEAEDALAALTDLVRRRRAALLCYEADPAACHRRVLAERITSDTGLACIDL